MYQIFSKDFLKITLVFLRITDPKLGLSEVCNKLIEGTYHTTLPPIHFHLATEPLDWSREHGERRLETP